VEVIAAPDSREAKKKKLSPNVSPNVSQVFPKCSTPNHQSPAPNIDDLANGSFQKDLKYSATVWMPASEIYQTDISVKDRDLITSGDGWLNDILIDFSMAILQHQFPDMCGLHSCLEVGSCRAPPVGGPAVQIVNTDVVGRGSHWITLSSIECENGRVEIFDSAGGCYLRLPAIRAVATFFAPKTEALILKFMSCDGKKNGNDCGVYSIANAVALCHGICPTDVQYKECEIRAHLQICLEQRKFTPFPSTHVPIPASQKSYGTLLETLFCSCKMPEDSELYFQCKGCKNWFHPVCEALGHKTKEWIGKQKTLRCINCQAKVRRRGKKQK
jgi:hypothetical protein